MALLGFEGFDDWSNAGSDAVPFGTGILGAWIGGAIPTTAGQLGGKGVVSSVGSNATLQLTSTYVTIVAGERYRTHGNFSSITGVFTFSDSGTAQCGVSINTSGKLFTWTGSTGTVTATGTTTLVNLAYYYIECKLTINNSTGSMIVKLNGVNEINTGNVDTQTTGNANLNQVSFVINTGANQIIDDVYLLDTTGPAPYNDFLGIIRVETSFGVANDSVTFTPLTSTNVSQISEIAFDSDTTYNFSPTTGQVDTFTHGSLSSTPTTIYGVIVRAAMRKDDVSNQNIRTKLISGATTQNGATNSSQTIYQRSSDMYTTDPSTGVAWANATAVNATKIGYEHV